LPEERVTQFLEINGHNGDSSHWRPNEDFTTLTRSFYLKNIYGFIQFTKDLYEMDAITTKQIPNMSIEDGDIVRIELHTKALKGLSFKDLELANMIDSFDFEKYDFIQLEKEEGYRSLIRKIKIDED
jgi:pterin-4a-carbinolamine dehydratase